MRLSDKKLSQNDTKTQVVEVWVPAEQITIAKNCFERIYPHREKETYVAGIKWTFLPDPKSTKIPMPAASMAFCATLRERQKTFLSDQLTYTYEHIPNINKTLKKIPWCHLHSILMSLHSAIYTSKKLFTYISQAHSGADVIFHYKSKFMDEVYGIVPILPLVMQKKVGPAASEWFSPNAYDCIRTYSINDEGTQAQCSTNDIYSQLFREWEPGTETTKLPRSTHTEGNIINVGNFDLMAFQREKNTVSNIPPIPPTPNHPEFRDESTACDASTVNSQSDINPPL